MGGRELIAELALSIVGGVALLLYGLRLLTDGLQRVGAARLRGLLTFVTGNRLRGLGSGALITAALQSSSATTVMLVGLAGAGIVTLRQTIPVLLGSDIGTTVTVQVIAFQILEASLAIVAAGATLFFLGRHARTRQVGSALLGLGLIFLGLKILSDGTLPLRDHSQVREFLLGLGTNPLPAIIASGILTAILHSSAATIGIAIVFASHDLLTLNAAVPIILGANVGTCATAWVSALGAPIEARRVAAAHVLLKFLAVALVYPLIGPFTEGIAHTADSLPRQIANAHTFFNIGLAVVFLPFSAPLANLVERLVRQAPEAQEEWSTPKFLDAKLLDTPALALGQATREALRMSELVEDMLRDTLTVFERDNLDLLEEIERRENAVDSLNNQIKLYVTRLSGGILSIDQSQEELAILAMTNDLETIGDIIDKNLMELAKKKIYKGLRFSEQGAKEIAELHGMVLKNFQRVISAFATHNAELGRQVIEAKTAIGIKERELKQAHIARLYAGLPESIETSTIHLDILTNLKRIDHHVVSIAYPIVEKPVT